MNKTKATTAQLGQLAEFMAGHVNLASGHSASLQEKIAFNQLWQDLAKQLNAMGGPVKTVAKWKQTWRDLKNATKKKADINKKKYKEEEVVSVLEPVFINGLEGVSCTTTATITHIDHSPRTDLSPSPPLPPPAIAILGSDDDADDGSAGMLSQSPPLPPQPPPRSRPKKRRRFHTPMDGFDMKLLKLEEEKVQLKKKKSNLK